MTDTDATRTAPVFTPESANKALAYIRAVVDDVVDAFARLRTAEEIRARALAGSPTTGRTPEARDRTLRDAENARATAREDLVRVNLELEKAGVELKDPETGLIDFPGERGGRRVYLCWKKGETSVEFWHDVESGFRGRRPIADPDDPPSD